MSKLENLLFFYDNYARRRGHITLMIEGIGAFEDRPAIFVFSDIRQAKESFNAYKQFFLDEDVNFSQLKLQNVQFKTTHFLNNLDWVRGLNPVDIPAIVVDHFAMEQMIKEDRKEYAESEIKKFCRDIATKVSNSFNTKPSSNVYGLVRVWEDVVRPIIYKRLK